MVIGSRPTIREAIFEDREAVRSLHETVGLPVGARDNWPGLWKDNPAWSEAAPKPDMGWVLETEGRIVGYLGNVHSLCRFAKKTLVATAASGYAVDPSYRGYGLLLAAAFFKQKDVDILLNTTANVVAASIFQRFNAIPLPQQDYNKILFWVLRPQPFVSSVLSKMGFSSTLAMFSSHILANFLRADIAIRNRKLQRKTTRSGQGGDIRVIDILEIGPEFDDLWFRKIGEENRLLSYRTAETLRWHFAGQRAKVLCCDRDGQLKGYAIVTREDSQTLRLARSWIVDIFVENDDPQVVYRLLEAAYSHAVADGSHVLEVMGFPQSIRKELLRSRPYSRMTPNLPYSYRARDSGVQKELQDADAWYACPFDGDASL